MGRHPTLRPPIHPHPLPESTSNILQHVKSLPRDLYEHYLGIEWITHLHDAACVVDAKIWVSSPQTLYCDRDNQNVTKRLVTSR